MAANGLALRAVLRRERAIALICLLAVAALAWAHLWTEAARMEAMPAAHMAGMEFVTAPWSASSLLLVFLMWAVMMVGMMLPSAAPAILLYGSMAGGERLLLRPVMIFTAGYVCVWTLFSLAATVLQATLQAGRLLDPMMTSASAWLSAAVLFAAGVYQWLPVKDACLRRCRNPLQMFLFRWRGGRTGAFRMGLEHGAYCVGCCWALMLVLFAAGVMNLLWVALIAGLVLAEKLLPGGIWVGRAAGLGLAVAGIWLVAGNL